MNFTNLLLQSDDFYPVRIKSAQIEHNSSTKKQYLCSGFRKIMANSNRQEIVCDYIQENLVQIPVDLKQFQQQYRAAHKWMEDYQ